MFFEPVFSKYRSGFWKRHIAQHCLLVIIRKWKKCLDRNGACGALLTDLPRAFDFFPHSILIAKPHAYRFDKTSTKKLLSYRKQIRRLAFGQIYYMKYHKAPSILGPLPFNVFLCDLLLFIPNIDFVIYAAENTPFATGSSEVEVINEIKSAAERLTLWFQNNGMKLNPDRF